MSSPEKRNMLTAAVTYTACSPVLSLHRLLPDSSVRHVRRPLSKYGRTAKVHRMVRSRRKVIHIQPTKKESALWR